MVSGHTDEPCTLEALIRGRKPEDPPWPVGKLKFDPTATDPNYTYKVASDDSHWQISANPRKPGLGRFYNKRPFFSGTFYSPAGPATAEDKHIDESAIAGDLFVRH